MRSYFAIWIGSRKGFGLLAQALKNQVGAAWKQGGGLEIKTRNKRIPNTGLQLLHLAFLGDLAAEILNTL